MFEETRKQGIPTNVITHSATISACEKGRQWQRAVGLFEEMSKRGIQSNVITWSATTNACRQDGQ